jgi:hypothetical protein
MIIVLRLHGRMVALRERQARERGRSTPVGGRSVNVVSSQPAPPPPPAGGTTGRADSSAPPQLEPTAVAASPRESEPGAAVPSRRKKKFAATTHRALDAQATVTERSLVPYVPTALAVQHGPLLALNWIIIEGDQPPLLSKGEFDRAVIKAGSRIVSTDDSHLDVTVYVMTNGGPANATLVYGLYIYRTAFINFQMGYASALAWVLLVVIILITVVQFIVARYWVYYEGDLK